MTKLIKSILAFTIAFSLAFPLTIPAVQAGENTPIGSWQTTSGESRYEITACKSGKAICAKLVWLRSDARSSTNLKHLNKVILTGARPVRANKWRGSLNYAGERLSGSLTLINNNRLRLSGCKFVFCKTINFKRI